MEKDSFTLEFSKIFKGFGNTSVPASLPKNNDVYKKLFGFLLAGDSFFFILNHNRLEIEHVSPEIASVLGYNTQEFDISFINEIIHPDDRSCFLMIGKAIVDFFAQLPISKLMKYKVRFDIRMRKKDGEYARILYQGILFEHDDNGKFLRTLGVYSDISYLKEDGRPVLSLIGMEGEPSYNDLLSRNIYVESKEELTNREKQILALLIQGKLSKEIGDILRISKQTVDTHRKNMLRRKNLINTSELVAKAIKNGWI